MRARIAITKRNAQRIAAYKDKLSQNLPSQIKLWRKRESRLLEVITGKSGLSIAALLVRQCPDPPKEIDLDPDTDDDESKHDDDESKHADEKNADKRNDEKTDEDSKVHQTDPTIRVWTDRDVASSQALDISEKQRVRLQQQAMALMQYCSEMISRASAMLKFVQKECPESRGDVVTMFREKYPHYGLRWIACDVCEKLGKLLFGWLPAPTLATCHPCHLSPHPTTHPSRY